MFEFIISKFPENVLALQIWILFEGTSSTYYIEGANIDMRGLKMMHVLMSFWNVKLEPYVILWNLSCEF